VSTVLSQNERWYIDAPEYAALLAFEINIRKTIRKADEYLKD
jgi:ribosomal protein S3